MISPPRQKATSVYKAACYEDKIYEDLILIRLIYTSFDPFFVGFFPLTRKCKRTNILNYHMVIGNFLFTLCCGNRGCHDSPRRLNQVNLDYLAEHELRIKLT